MRRGLLGKTPAASAQARIASVWPEFGLSSIARRRSAMPRSCSPRRTRTCGAARNYTGYCNPEVDKLIDQQSIETDVAKRKQLVWQIERKLIEDDARPVIFFPHGAVCRSSSLKGLTLMVNSIYNGQRFEDLWVDK
jgi:ABC-type transport system substrate-binding protein